MAKAGWSLKPQVTMARRELYLALGKSAVSQAAIDELKAKAATLDARKSADQGRRPPGFPPRHLLHDPGHPDLGCLPALPGRPGHHGRDTGDCRKFWGLCAMRAFSGVSLDLGERVAWILRLVKIGAEGEGRSVDVMESIDPITSAISLIWVWPWTR